MGARHPRVAVQVRAAASTLRCVAARYPLYRLLLESLAWLGLAASPDMLLRYFEMRGEVRQAISVMKKRGGAHELVPGGHVNLERCMRADGRFDGHIVQGHVDCTGVCASMRDLEGSWEFVFNHHKDPQFVTVPKGSITVNGVSLTVVDCSEESFSVHVIPYTFEHTNFREILPGTKVNLEFDIVGKYVARLIGSR